MLRLTDSDRAGIAGFLGRDPYLNLYAIGDLDERFRPYVSWFGLRRRNSLSAVVCIYSGAGAPTLMALCGREETAAMRQLLSDLLPVLPRHFQAHLSPGLEDILLKDHDSELSVPHHKMAFGNTAISPAGTASVLTEKDIPALLALYRHSYPGNWFEPEMLRLNRYYGIHEDGRLAAAAGTHVCSAEFKAAALGNITTAPELRGRGYGGAVTSALTAALLSDGMRVGLNVKKSNTAAIRCYRKAGFEVCGEFGEWVFRKK